MIFSPATSSAQAAAYARAIAEGDAAKEKASKPSKEPRDKKSTEERMLENAIETSARFLVTHNGRLLATFVSEDDALLFEGELADIDRARGTQSALCEVRDRKGRRLGGYIITAGILCVFLRDYDRGRRLKGFGHRSA